MSGLYNTGILSHVKPDKLQAFLPTGDDFSTEFLTALRIPNVCRNRVIEIAAFNPQRCYHLLKTFVDLESSQKYELLIARDGRPSLLQLLIRSGQLHKKPLSSLFCQIVQDMPEDALDQVFQTLQPATRELIENFAKLPDECINLLVDKLAPKRVGKVFLINHFCERYSSFQNIISRLNAKKRPHTMLYILDKALPETLFFGMKNLSYQQLNILCAESTSCKPETQAILAMARILKYFETVADDGIGYHIMLTKQDHLDRWNHFARFLSAYTSSQNTTTHTQTSLEQFARKRRIGSQRYYDAFQHFYQTINADTLTHSARQNILDTFIKSFPQLSHLQNSLLNMIPIYDKTKLPTSITTVDKTPEYCDRATQIEKACQRTKKPHRLPNAFIELLTCDNLTAFTAKLEQYETALPILVHMHNDSQRSLFYYLCIHGKIDQADKLLEVCNEHAARAMIQSKTKQGYTPIAFLFQAVRNKEMFSSLAESLIRKMANFTSKDIIMADFAAQIKLSRKWGTRIARRNAILQNECPTKTQEYFPNLAPDDGQILEEILNNRYNKAEPPETPSARATRINPFVNKLENLEEDRETPTPSEQCEAAEKENKVASQEREEETDDEDTASECSVITEIILNGTEASSRMGTPYPRELPEGEESEESEYEYEYEYEYEFGEEESPVMFCRSVAQQSSQSNTTEMIPMTVFRQPSVEKNSIAETAVIRDFLTGSPMVDHCPNSAAAIKPEKLNRDYCSPSPPARLLEKPEHGSTSSSPVTAESTVYFNTLQRLEQLQVAKHEPLPLSSSRQTEQGPRREKKAPCPAAY